MTTPKRARPVFARSQTASPEISPQHLSSRVSSQAAKKLHLHSHHDSKDSGFRGRYLHRQSGLSLPAPGRAIVEIAKSKVPGASGENSRDDPLENTNDFYPHREFNSADVEREERFQAAREEELRNSLDSLTQLATSVTRRLDGIYYAILEKASALRAAVDSLQKLLSDCTDLRQTFDQDASELKDKIQTQIAEFDAFRTQARAVDEMELRIRTGTERAQTLNHRLERARERVRRWEKREAEWQARTSGRIRASIISTLCVIGVLLILLMLRAVYLYSQSPSHKHFDDILATITIPFHDMQMMVANPASSEGLVKEDPRLHLFDEL